MLQTNKVVIGAINRDKMREYEALFKEVLPTNSLQAIPLERTIANPERFASLVEGSKPGPRNAENVARALNQATHYPVLAESSELILDPQASGSHLRENDTTPSCANIPTGCQIESALDLLGDSPRQASYVCSLALHVEGVMLTASEVRQGTVIPQPRGPVGAGFDSIFIPAGSSCTLSEMSAAEKMKFSPRNIAFQKIWNKAQDAGLELVRQNHH